MGCQIVGISYNKCMATENQQAIIKDKDVIEVKIGVYLHKA